LLEKLCGEKSDKKNIFRSNRKFAYVWIGQTHQF
jgi:hypothetical protein